MQRSALVFGLVGAVALACSAAVFFVLRSGGEAPEGTVPVAGAPAGTDADPVTEATPEESPARRRRKVVEEEKPTRFLDLAGRVVEGDAGIAGARVEAYAVPRREAGMTQQQSAALDAFRDVLTRDDIEQFGTQLGIRGAGSSSARRRGPTRRGIGRGAELGMRLLQRDGSMDRVTRFIALAAAELDMDAPYELTAATETDFEGAFQFESVPEGEVELRIRAAGFVRQKRRVQAGDTDVTVLLVRGKALEGSVVSGGAGIAGATVRTRTGTVETGPGGGFRVDDAVSPRESVIVTAPGYLAAARFVDVAAEGPTEPVLIELEPAGRVTGLVLDLRSEPIAGATVETVTAGNPMMAFMGMGSGTQLAPPAPHAISGNDGTFELDGLMGGVMTLRVRCEGYLTAEVEDVEIVVGDAAGPIEVRLTGECAVRGYVSDHTGAPVEGAEVQVELPAPQGQMGMAARMMGGWWASSRTDADGTYFVGSLPAGDRKVRVTAEGFLRAESQLTFPAESALTHDAQLAPGHSVSGRVLSPDGEPVTGATVEVEWGKSGPANPMAAFMPGQGPDATTQSDADGAFEFTGLQAGPYELTASAETYLDATAAGIEPGANDIELTLAAGSALRGHVVDETSGLPVAGAWVIRRNKKPTGPQNPWMAAMNQAPQVLTDATGQFAITGIAAGEYELVSRRRGHGDSLTLDVTLGEGETVDDLELVLRQGATLSGRVVERGDGPPVEGALVFVGSGEGPMQGLATSDFTGGEPQAPPDSVSTHTDASGVFVLEGLTPGDVTVQVRSAHHAAATLTGVTAPGPEVKIEVGAGGTIEGFLRDSKKRPVSARQVMATQGAMGMGGVRTAQTDGTGFYRMERLKPGSYQLMYTDTKSGFGVGGMTNVTVQDGEVVRHDFGPKVGTRPVSGDVVQNGKPLEGATVVITGPGGMKFQQTGPKGDFTFEGLDAGEYTVTVQREMMGGGLTSEKVTVSEGSAVPRVRIELSSLTLAGTVVDQETGEPVQLAQITLNRGGARATSLEEVISSTGGRGITGADGRFSLEGVEAGDFTLQVTASGYAQTTLEGVRAGGAPLRIELSRGEELTVVVLDADGNPVRGASVSAEDSSGTETVAFDMSMSGVSGDDGKATLRLAPGRYTLHVDASGHPSKSVVAEGAAGTVTVRFDRGGSLDVTLTDASGAPVAGAIVEFLDASGRPISARVSIVNMMGGSPRTDDSGHLLRKGLPPGKVQVVVKPATGAPITRDTTIRAGAVTKLEIRLQ